MKVLLIAIIATSIALTPFAANAQFWIPGAGGNEVYRRGERHPRQQQPSYVLPLSVAASANIIWFLINKHKTKR